MEVNDEEYFEHIVPCVPQSTISHSNFKLILSKCTVNKFNFHYDIDDEIIQIEDGMDLIGTFEKENSTISEGMKFMNYEDEDKIKQSAIFTFSGPTANIGTNKLYGKSTQDRKNVIFYFYYSKDSKIQVIQAKGSFLKENSEVVFEMNPLVDLYQGNSFIPSQLCKAENEEYLYISNQIGSTSPNFKNIYEIDFKSNDDENNNNNETKNNANNNTNTKDDTNINDNNNDNYDPSKTEGVSEEINETWIIVYNGSTLLSTGLYSFLIIVLLF